MTEEHFTWSNCSFPFSARYCTPAARYLMARSDSRWAIDHTFLLFLFPLEEQSEFLSDYCVHAVLVLISYGLSSLRRIEGVCGNGLLQVLTLCAWNCVNRPPHSAGLYWPACAQNWYERFKDYRNTFSGTWRLSQIRTVLQCWTGCVLIWEGIHWTSFCACITESSSLIMFTVFTNIVGARFSWFEHLLSFFPEPPSLDRFQRRKSGKVL